jgi:hypothetical protein
MPDGQLILSKLVHPESVGSGPLYGGTDRQRSHFNVDRD